MDKDFDDKRDEQLKDFEDKQKELEELLKELAGEKDKIRSLDKDLDDTKSQRRGEQRAAVDLANQLRDNRDPKFVESELEAAEQHNELLGNSLGDLNQEKKDKEAELQGLIDSDSGLKNKLRDLEAHKEIDVGLQETVKTLHDTHNELVEKVKFYYDDNRIELEKQDKKKIQFEGLCSEYYIGEYRVDHFRERMQFLKALKEHEWNQRKINADKEDMHLQCKAIP